MKMTFQPKKRSRSKVHGAHQAEEKYWLPEEQKEENSYQLKAASMWPFLLSKVLQLVEGIDEIFRIFKEK